MDEKTLLDLDKTVQYYLDNWQTIISNPDSASKKDKLALLMKAVTRDKLSVEFAIAAKALAGDQTISEDLQKTLQALQTKLEETQKSEAEAKANTEFAPDASIPVSAQRKKYDAELEGWKKKAEELGIKRARIEELIGKLENPEAFIEEVVDSTVTKKSGEPTVDSVLMEAIPAIEKQLNIIGPVYTLANGICLTTMDSDSKNIVPDYENLGTLVEIMKDDSLLQELFDASRAVETKAKELGFIDDTAEKTNLTKQINKENAIMGTSENLASAIYKSVSAAKTMQAIDEKRSQRALEPQSGFRAWFNKTFRKGRMEKIAKETEEDDKAYNAAKSEAASVMYALGSSWSAKPEAQNVLAEFAEMAKTDSQEPNPQVNAIMEIIKKSYIDSKYVETANLAPVIQMCLNSKNPEEDMKKMGKTVKEKHEGIITPLKEKLVEVNGRLDKSAIILFDDYGAPLSSRAQEIAEKGFFGYSIAMIKKIKENPTMMEHMIPVLVAHKVMTKRGITTPEAAQEAGYSIPETELETIETQGKQATKSALAAIRKEQELDIEM